MKKKIYIKEIEAKSKELADYSRDKIAPKLTELKDLAGSIVWQGNARDTYIKIYNEKIDKLIGYNNNMAKISEFLLTVTENYDDTNKKIVKAYEELIDEIEKVEML